MPTQLPRFTSPRGAHPQPFGDGQTQYFKSLTSNQELIEVLTYGWGNYGTAPDDSSMGYHLLLTAHYLHGGFYPVGGPAELGKHIVQQIERSGGLCLVRAAVERLVIESGRAVGVEVKGTEVGCRAFPLQERLSWSCSVLTRYCIACFLTSVSLAADPRPLCHQLCRRLQHLRQALARGAALPSAP